MFRSLLIGFTLITTFQPGNTSASTTKQFSWPLVAPQERRYSFEDASKARLSLTIRGTRGHTLYVLRCSSTDLDGEGEVMPGDFACWLRATDPKATPRIGPENLLNSTPFAGNHFDDADAHGHDRESIWAWQLDGNCGNHPDYGRKRVFRLRGMRLVLLFENVAFSAHADDSQPVLKAFDLSISVQGDETAISSLAEPSEFNAPTQEAHGCEILKRDMVSQEAGVRFSPVRATQFDFEFPVETPAVNVQRDIHSPDWSHAIVAADDSLAYEFSCRANEGAREATTPKVIPGSRYSKEGIGIVNAGIWCRLQLGGEGPNLLDLTLDPYSRTSRAEIFPDQLEGACREYPDWGTHRSFRLRGMELVLTIDQVRFEPVETDGKRPSPRNLNGLRIHVNVTPDSTATTVTPEQVKYADWSLLPVQCSTPVLNPRFGKKPEL